MKDTLIVSKTTGHVYDVSPSGIQVALDQSGCDVCNRGLCFSKGRDSFIVVVKNPPQGLQVGQSVQLQLSSSTGNWAIFLLYGLPFLVMMLVLMISLQLGAGEGVAGLLSIVSLVPYYLLLSTRKNWMKDQCHIEILA